MKAKFKKSYMDFAKIFASLSHAKRLHVGVIVVKDDRIKFLKKSSVEMEKLDEQ
jgi:deoxycytidylate deaminase